MKKLLILVVSLLVFATSCLKDGANTPSSSSSYEGSITVTDLDTGEVTYSEDKASIVVSIPQSENKIMDIMFKGVKFDKMMPLRLNIKVADIPFNTTVSEDDTAVNFVFDAANIIPTVGDVPYKKYKIDRIWGCLGKQVDVMFEMWSKSKRVHFSTVKGDGGSSNTGE